MQNIKKRIVRVDGSDQRIVCESHLHSLCRAVWSRVQALPERAIVTPASVAVR